MLAQKETVSFCCKHPCGNISPEARGTGQTMSLRIHVLQHTDSSVPGSVLDWLKTKGHASTVVRIHKGDALPSVDETDWLIVMGGSMNVDDTEKYPWLLEEKKLLKEAIAAKKTCFGICLGGQLLAQALGAEVKKHEHWELGWHTVHFGSGPESRLMVFQWHEDTLDIPDGALRLAKSGMCLNQAFRFRKNAYGLQFHIEVTPMIIKSWIKAYVKKGDIDIDTKNMIKESRENKLEFERQANLIYLNLTGII